MDMDMGDSQGQSDMDGMGGMGGMAMTMVFQTNMATPLYTRAWTPNSAGTYAGTCIFLVALAIMARVLLAMKARMEARWLDRETHRIYGSSSGDSPLVGRDAEARKTMSISDSGVEETVVVLDRKRTAVQPWRLTVDPVRAVMDVIIAGVGYLL
jgi:hypothetical protein